MLFVSYVNAYYHELASPDGIIIVETFVDAAKEPTDIEDDDGLLAFVLALGLSSLAMYFRSFKDKVISIRKKELTEFVAEEKGGLPAIAVQ